MKKILFLSLIFLSTALFFNTGCKEGRTVLTDEDRALLHGILNHWQTWVPDKESNGVAPLMTFEDLYRSGLNAEQQDLLDRIQAIDPKKQFGFRGNYLGNPAENVNFKRIDDQWIEKNGKKEKLSPQYLPEKVYAAYDKMMQAMLKDLGRRLFIESGYRSPAYQLYTFLFYLPKHGYSLKETGKWVALPGYSEHGAPHQQAIDFINEKGINGENDVREFEKLPEYAWLQKHAGEFGFELSYPRGSKGITFEPWHWRYCDNECGKKDLFRNPFKK